MLKLALVTYGVIIYLAIFVSAVVVRGTSVFTSIMFATSGAGMFMMITAAAIILVHSGLKREPD